MKYFVILNAAFYLVCFNSCKQPDPAPRVPISDVRLKESLLIKKGSYFVYLDSNTNQRDSFYVLEDAYTYYKHHDARNIDYEVVYYNCYHSTKSGSNFGLTCGGGRQDAIYWGYAVELIQQTGGILLKLPFNEGLTDEVYGPKVTAVKYYDSLESYGQTYFSVYESECLNGSINGHTFFSMQSGAVIRFSTDISGIHHVYNLVNSKTNR